MVCLLVIHFLLLLTSSPQALSERFAHQHHILHFLKLLIRDTSLRRHSTSGLGYSERLSRVMQRMKWEELNEGLRKRICGSLSTGMLTSRFDRRITSNHVFTHIPRSYCCSFTISIYLILQSLTEISILWTSDRSLKDTYYLGLRTEKKLNVLFRRQFHFRFGTQWIFHFWFRKTKTRYRRWLYQAVQVVERRHALG